MAEEPNMAASIPQPRSPYDGLGIGEWSAKTRELLADFPVAQHELVDVVLGEWAGIFESRIGRAGLTIGEDIEPVPQIMGTFLHELIPNELARRYEGRWRRDTTGKDKDLVYIPDDYWSTEIKTSSDRSKLPGNRSAAQPTAASKKLKSGFYLGVNFDSWKTATERGEPPGVKIVRLGWIDHSDWVAQVAESGQRADVSPEAFARKFVELYRRRR